MSVVVIVQTRSAATVIRFGFVTLLIVGFEKSSEIAVCSDGQSDAATTDVILPAVVFGRCIFWIRYCMKRNPLSAASCARATSERLLALSVFVVERLSIATVSVEKITRNSIARTAAAPRRCEANLTWTMLFVTA